MEDLTRDLGRAFLVSGDVPGRLEGKGAYTMIDLGERQLRGREARVRIYAIELRIDT